MNLMRYISYNKTLVFNYYADMKDLPLYDLFRQSNINPKNQLIAFSDYIWKYCPDTGRSTGSHIIFYQVGPIYNDTHVPGPVSQPSAESEYNAACNAVIDLEHFRMLIHELLNKYPYIVPDEYYLVMLDSKSSVCMANNGKYINYASHISIRVKQFINGEK